MAIGAPGPSGLGGMVVWMVRVFVTLLALTGCQKLFGEFEVSPSAQPSIGSNVACATGAHRCNGEYLLRCEDGEWTLAETCATKDHCDSTVGRCTVCSTAGQRTCRGAERVQCSTDRSEWTRIEVCESEDICSPTTCAPCRPGDVQCVGDPARELQVCNDEQRWETVDTCDSETLCRLSEEAAETSPGGVVECLEPRCEPGALRCDGPYLQRCRQSSDNWDLVDVCASTALCAMAANAGSGSAATQNMCPLGCGQAGRYRCTDNVPERCAEDLTQWVPLTDGPCPTEAPCDTETGTCRPCTPGTFRCNEASVEECTAEQTWKPVKTCETAALCSVQQDQAGKWSWACKEPACAPGETRCNPDNPAVLEQCNTDRTGFRMLQVCASAALCNATDARCEPPVCMPLADGSLPYRCLEKQFQQCKADLTGYETLKTCAADEFCFEDNPAAPCHRECPLSGLVCNGSELLSCTADGDLVHQADCATPELCRCAANGTCLVGPNGCGIPLCGGALPQTRCVGSTLEVCQTGRAGWDAVAECGSPELCFPGIPPDYAQGYCAVCEVAGVVECNEDATGTRQCAPDRLGYTGEQTCQFGCLERPEPSADYCAVCQPNELRCAGTMPGNSKLQRCTDDQSGLIDVEPCPFGCIDQGTNDRCAACVAGESRCSGRDRMVCNADRSALTRAETCPVSCIENGIADYCGECKPGTKQCNGKVLETCGTNGEWGSGGTETCSIACVEVSDGDDHCAAVCTPGTFRCGSSMTGMPANLLQQCNEDGDDWVTVETCGSAALCDAANRECDDCVPGEYSCTGSVLRVCDATGHWAPAPSACSENTLRTCTDGVLDVKQCTICDATNAECDDCSGTNTYSCANGMLRRCDESGHWQSANNCAGATLRTCEGTSSTPKTEMCSEASLCDEANNECDVCPPGNYRCNGGDVERCNSSGQAWVPVSYCDSMGTTRECDGDSVVTGSCGPGKSCNAEGTACIDGCTPGATRCATGGGVQTCDADGNWGAASSCPFGCADGACRECMPGATECTPNGTGVRTCGTDGTWGTPTQCTFGCLAGECAACADGAVGCASGNQPRICMNGAWVNKGPACSGDTPTCEAGACVCTATKCSGDDLLVCDEGVPGLQPCPDGCVNAACAECNDDTDCDEETETCNTTTGTCVPIPPPP